MRKLLTLFGTLVTSACIVASAHAQDVEQTVKRVEHAYNIDAIDRAETIRLESDYRLPFESHEYSAGFHDLAHQKFHIIFDLKAKRGSHEFVTEIAGTSYHGRHLIQNEVETFISYGPNTYTESEETDFFTRFGGTFRASDVLLAYWLTRENLEARHLREAMWLGRSHDVLEMDYPNSPPLHVFVRKEDGAITKMERDLPDGRKVFYTFRNHDRQGELFIAREHSLFVDQRHVYFGLNRNIILNDPTDRGAFEIDPGLEPEAERTDQFEMTVRAVVRTDNADQTVHQVCQGEGCTTFIIMADAVIGYGMSSGFADRLEAYRTQTGSEQPLRYAIAADHHDEDIGGAGEATDSGATLLVTDQTATKLQRTDAEHDLEIVSEPRTIGTLMLLSLPTDHSVSALIAYHETQGVLMQTGHYYSSFVDQPSYARQTAVSLYEALPARIKTQAKTILSGQDLKAETWSDFVLAVEAHEVIRCHGNRRICQTGSG